MSYASIVPLIGGETIAMENVFGERPKYIMTYEGFQANESHLLNHYNHEVPYLNLSEGASYTEKVNVINTVCPCAGLSSLSPSAASNNPMNEWMFTSAEYVLSEVQPKVFWGENAPRLASKMGEPVVRRLRKIGEDNGYTFSIFKTKSILHGLSQVRDRTFYFFWKGNEVPLFEYVLERPTMIADDIREVERKDDDPMSQILCNEKKPSEEPYYRYVLEVAPRALAEEVPPPPLTTEPLSASTQPPARREQAPTGRDASGTPMHIRVEETPPSTDAAMAAR